MPKNNPLEIKIEKPTNYLLTLEELKTKIKEARIKAALSVNSEMIKLYWHIGNRINKEVSLKKYIYNV